MNRRTEPDHPEAGGIVVQDFPGHVVGAVRYAVTLGLGNSAEALAFGEVAADYPVITLIASPLTAGIKEGLSFTLGFAYADASYVQARWGAELTAEADGYAKADNLTGTGVGLLYFEDKNMAVLLPESEMPVLPQDRT